MTKLFIQTIEPEAQEGPACLQTMSGGLEIALPKQKLQFLRTKGETIKDETGNIVRIKLEEGEKHSGETLPAQRSKGHRKGVLLAFVDTENDAKVCIGYSACHKNDRFDYKNGSHVEGLGTFFALNKAQKHRDTLDFVISTSPKDRQLPKTVIKIPQTIADSLQNFIYRCSCYYKDKELPEWAIKFAQLDKEPADEVA